MYLYDCGKLLEVNSTGIVNSYIVTAYTRTIATFSIKMIIKQKQNSL